MARVSPLNAMHEESGAVLAPYGPAEAGVGVVQVYHGVGAEYAALRRGAGPRAAGCVVLDQPHRGTLEIRGADRRDFLNRMVTQELKGLEPMRSRRSFWLNRKGRIDADLRLVELGDRMLADVDVHAAGRAVEGLSSFLFSEDVQITDVTDRVHRFGVHGPGAAALLARWSKPLAGGDVAGLQPGEACVVSIGGGAGAEVVVERQDATGEIGLELTVPVEAAAAVYAAIAAPAEPPRELEGAAFVPASPEAATKAARCGWHAFNMARVEAGWPLYYLDFGPDSLPHETGSETLNDRVSFKKGCYLGQEVVARMQSLGHPKQKLVGLRLEPVAPVAGEAPAQAVTGSPVTAEAKDGAEVVGAVTSSTVAPMLGSAAVCFAMVKHKFAAADTRLFVRAENGAWLTGTARESLVFYRR